MNTAARTPHDHPSGFLADLLRHYPDLDATFLGEAGSAFERISVSGGETLVRQGEPSDAIYVLLNGRLVASITDAAGAPVRLGEIARGELIGEMTVLTGGQRSATVTALRDSRLLRMSNAAFERFMQRHPAVMRRFIEVLMHRLTLPRTGSGERLSTVALVPGDPSGMPDAFRSGLEAALAAGTRVLSLDAVTAQARFPGRFDDASDASIAAFLNDLEHANGMLLYRCDPTLTRWTRLALRQADRILVVGTGAPATEAGRHAADRPDGDALRGCELVLLHPPGVAAPKGTATPLASGRYRRHHHVATGDPSAPERLARHLLGRSLGLALGGGGARAFMEIGVLRALEAARIPVDVVGGTSMGAVIGALVAHGADAAGCQAAMREVARRKPFSGLAIPRVALLSGRRLHKVMQFLFDDRRIEDLRLRYFCVSCNLTRGTVDAHEDGPLARWVAASNAIPGIIPPIVDGGDLHVDGGLLNNVPADLMARRNAGPVIAVNVSNTDGFLATAPGRADRMPGIGRILVRAMLLAASNHAVAMRQHAALHLAPATSADVNDWHRLDELVETGYRHAMQTLETWTPHVATNG